MDAICINQQDVEERNDQVTKIADIHTSADKVIIWLGLEEDNSSLAIDALKLLPSKIEIHWPIMTICATNLAEGSLCDLIIALKSVSVQRSAQDFSTTSQCLLD